MLENLFKSEQTQDAQDIQWEVLDTIEQISQILIESKSQPVLIFKHSTRCGTSAMALDRLQRKWHGEEMKQVKPYYLDLISFRQVSNQIADQFDVWHQSPQVLLIKDGQCVYDASHLSISYEVLKYKIG
ncbi:MAG: bacillithiol system redox-active protein YtxJ [Cyclobacteriaceae bacterium]